MSEEETRKADPKNEAEQFCQSRTKTLQQSYYDYVMSRVIALEKENPAKLKTFLKKYAEENGQIKDAIMPEPHLIERLTADSNLREDFLNRFQAFIGDITLEDWLHPEQVES